MAAAKWKKESVGGNGCVEREAEMTVRMKDKKEKWIVQQCFIGKKREIRKM